MNLPFTSDFVLVDKNRLKRDLVQQSLAWPGLGPLTASAFPQDDANGLLKKPR